MKIFGKKDSKFYLFYVSQQIREFWEITQNFFWEFFNKILILCFHGEKCWWKFDLFVPVHPSAQLHPSVALWRFQQSVAAQETICALVELFSIDLTKHRKYGPGVKILKVLLNVLEFEEFMKFVGSNKKLTNIWK